MAYILGIRERHADGSPGRAKVGCRLCKELSPWGKSYEHAGRLAVAFGWMRGRWVGRGHYQYVCPKHEWKEVQNPAPPARHTTPNGGLFPMSFSASYLVENSMMFARDVQ
jgi:hypothetical protein